MTVNAFPHETYRNQRRDQDCDEVLTPLDPLLHKRRVAAPQMVGVAIPARNERRDIAAALRAIKRALDHPAMYRTRRIIVVADDDSDDNSGELAKETLGRDGEVVMGRFGSAGAARGAAVSRLLELADRLPPHEVWLATTDADSRVPSSWLGAQIGWWKMGADAVAGLVKPIWEGKGTSPLRHRYEAMMAALGTGPGHPHVFGANLGFTAEAYLKAGGLSPLATGEDHALWNALRASGCRAVSVADDPVLTSTRLVGRAPGGFASLLTDLAAGSAD